MPVATLGDNVQNGAPVGDVMDDAMAGGCLVVLSGAAILRGDDVPNIRDVVAQACGKGERTAKEQIMNRRQFIGSAAIASLLPIWTIRPAKRKTVDLLSFCRMDPGRWDLTAPFEQTEWTYATDAKICVRVRPESSDVRIDERRVPPFQSLAWTHDVMIGWKPPKFNYIEKKRQCPECECGIINGAPCPECYGYGEMGTCKKCKGIGLVNDDCSRCKGTGQLVWPCEVECDGLVFDAKLYDKIKGLPGLEFPVHKEVCGGPKGQPVRFRFEGGTGLLMPLTR